MEARRLFTNPFHRRSTTARLLKRVRPALRTKRSPDQRRGETFHHHRWKTSWILNRTENQPRQKSCFGPVSHECRSNPTAHNRSTKDQTCLFHKMALPTIPKYRNSACRQITQLDRREPKDHNHANRHPRSLTRHQPQFGWRAPKAAASTSCKKASTEPTTISA